MKETMDCMEGLVASGRAPEIPDSEDLYGWLVGSWDLDIRTYWKDVSAHGLKGEVHFERVLEGRAVQDVWIMPRRSDRKGPKEHGVDSYGTTLRVWDAKLGAWRVTWINPVTGARNDLVARRHGRDIVQLGHHEGTPIRWIFSECTTDSFRWTGEALDADGQTWTLTGDFRATRRR
jgi:hypothetical protein